jgi:hypothetical protein
LAILLLFAYVRANRVAYMLASVPELVKRVISAFGTIFPTCSASSTSDSCDVP